MINTHQDEFERCQKLIEKAKDIININEMLPVKIQFEKDKKIIVMNLFRPTQSIKTDIFVYDNNEINKLGYSKTVKYREINDMCLLRKENLQRINEILEEKVLLNS